MRNVILLIVVLFSFGCSQDDTISIPLLTFKGQVIDCDNGESIANATVELHRYFSNNGIPATEFYRGLKETTNTDSNGNYFFEIEKETDINRYKTEVVADKYWEHKSLDHGKIQNHSLQPLSWVKLKLINQSNNITVNEGLLRYTNDFDIVCQKVTEYFEGEDGQSEQTLILNGIGNTTTFLYWGTNLEVSFTAIKDTLFLTKHDTIYTEIVY